jgi:hypothetical protein
MLASAWQHADMPVVKAVSLIDVPDPLPRDFQSIYNSGLRIPETGNSYD